MTISRDGKAIDLKVPESVLNSISEHGIEEFVTPRFVAEKISGVYYPAKKKNQKAYLPKSKSFL